jgi:hypothetical protein
MVLRSVGHECGLARRAINRDIDFDRASLQLCIPQQAAFGFQLAQCAQVRYFTYVANLD